MRRFANAFGSSHIVRTLSPVTLFTNQQTFYALKSESFFLHDVVSRSEVIIERLISQGVVPRGQQPWDIQDTCCRLTAGAVYEYCVQPNADLDGHPLLKDIKPMITHALQYNE
eukprot:PhF_6_TR38977/c0_g1_i1/m.58326